MRTVSICIVAGCAALSGCLGLSGPDCKDELRGLTAIAALTSVAPDAAPGDTGTAQLNLHEARDHTSKSTSARELSWFVGSGLDRSGVTAVHVHEEGTARLLFTIPLETPTGPPYVITQIFTRRAYTGPTSWSEIYELVGSQRTYIDVHTTEFPDGELRGALSPQNANWQVFTHAYCS